MHGYYCSGWIVHNAEYSRSIDPCRFSVFTDCNVMAMPVVLDSNPQLDTVCVLYNRVCEHVMTHIASLLSVLA
jgi:hypothetical protein